MTKKKQGHWQEADHMDPYANQMTAEQLDAERQAEAMKPLTRAQQIARDEVNRIWSLPPEERKKVLENFG